MKQIFEIIPSHDDEKVWNIRITDGDFIETVIQYDAVGINEDEETLTYSFKVISSPIEGLSSDDDNLQVIAGNILINILEEQFGTGQY
jgi:hypothetical protein